ncbi:alpha/beta fold hydrolase [Novosphingobium pentaromativorans]|uniref:Alpha/beta hydrolase n=1 Tax=Novosphingobium pentaromativorans US6-1 TaxID=1088721 RepID=G6E7B1_9SPHN|nr:alpha/beta fold hydrolase [Novosphingobium pentaromativorans]AIT81682.1 hydrolase [Novosphingobium pentaromativorans US6-1]EHJ62734.1 alpha/beta hydrolase [Novosphingobium pentaromativorans US6-1]
MSELRKDYIEGFGGTRLAVHTLGQGRPLVLVHGLFSSAEVNWIKYGNAQILADAGFEVIMPDLRAHGESEAPHDPDAYPEDVLVEDLTLLIAELGLSDFDLGGFSLGARTSVRGVLAGLSPRKLILGGMGLSGLSGWARRSAHFVDAIDRFGSIERGDPAFVAQAFMKSMKIDRVAARLLLESVDDTSADAIARVTMPALCVCGKDDADNGSAQELAEALPQGRYVETPGNHMSSVTFKDMGRAMAEFLDE